MIKSTRGLGLLEPLLTNLRIYYTKKIIPKNFKDFILDIGCGQYPLFLKKINFKNKFGIDINIKNKINNINLLSCNVNQGLPFKDNLFQVVTMLAVIEHLDRTKIEFILSECRRVLKKDGLLIITTPTPLSRFLLSTMANLGLVSKEEIYEHKKYYDKKEIIDKLLTVGFKKEKIKIKKFEFFINLMVYTHK